MASGTAAARATGDSEGGERRSASARALALGTAAGEGVGVGHRRCCYVVGGSEVVGSIGECSGDGNNRRLAVVRAADG